MKIISYNVHNWQNSEKKYNYSCIYKDIVSLSPDLLVLNECNKRNNQVENLAKKLNCFYVFASTSSPNFGNAIFSRKEISESYSLSLPYNRVALIAVIDNLRICVIHLDHTSENKRIKQLEFLFSKTDVDILIGDLNSLCKKDYVWEQIIQERKNNNWEEPSEKVYNFLKKDFYDALEISDETSIENYSAHVGNPKYRIDYIFFTRKKSWNVLSYITHTECIESDHYPIEVIID